MTSKLQVTVPKAIADEYRIKPGDDILWVASGDTVRVVLPRARPRQESVATKLRLFDLGTERQSRRQQGARVEKTASRGWSREDLYDRGRSR